MRNTNVAQLLCSQWCMCGMIVWKCCFENFCDIKKIFGLSCRPVIEIYVLSCHHKIMLMTCTVRSSYKMHVMFRSLFSLLCEIWFWVKKKEKKKRMPRTWNYCVCCTCQKWLCIKCLHFCRRKNCAGFSYILHSQKSDVCKILCYREHFPAAKNAVF